MIRVYLRQWSREAGSWEPYLREILKRDYGVFDAVVARDRWGKPFLHGSELCFNVSHSGDRLAIAVSAQPVGVDIERMRPVKEGMYRKVVRPEEQELIGEERERDFIRLWTLKESFTKAEGRGLRIPLKEYYFQKEKETGDYRAYYRGEKSPWTFHIEETVADGYVISVCGLDEKVVFWTEQER